MKTKGMRALVVSALVATIGLLGLSAPASAAANTIVVTQGPTGIISVSPATALAAQLVNFEFSSVFNYTDAQGKSYGGDPEIFQARDGSTLTNAKLTELDAKLAQAGQGGAAGSAGMQWILSNFTFFSGDPFTGANKFGEILSAGTYYVAQFQLVPDLNLKPSTTVKTFKVTGPSQQILPVVDGKVSVTNTNGPDVFTAYSTTAGTGKLRNGQVAFVNKTGSITSPAELHFFALWQVVSGTTVQQACNWFNTGTASPFVPNGGKAAFGTMSSQRQINGWLNVPLGTYFVWSGIPDRDTGTPHVKECEGLIVQVVA